MKKMFAAILIVTMSSFGLALEAQSRTKTKRGALIGGVAGAVLGGVIGNNTGSGDQKKGAIIGAVAGTAIGAGIGAYMDKQERELRQIEGLDVYRTDTDELNVVLRNEVLFDFDSSALRQSSRNTLVEMADVFERYRDTTISVEGHTDSIGSDAYNQRLSERRAGSVSSYLQNLGVDRYRVRTIGFGESRPVASNATANGRQQNRRVEIKVKANS